MKLQKNKNKKIIIINSEAPSAEVVMFKIVAHKVSIIYFSLNFLRGAIYPLTLKHFLTKSLAGIIKVKLWNTQA
jgi:hypothetical protein